MGTSNDIDIFKKYKNNCSLFVETGSYIGDGIQSALNSGFENVISIEISKYQYDYCKNRFGNDERIKLILGDTGEVLDSILANYVGKHQRIFFWLDAHNSGGNTGGKGVAETILKEIEIIINYVQKNNVSATLCMDDINDAILMEIKKVNALKFIAKELCINPQTNAFSENYIVVYEVDKSFI